MAYNKNTTVSWHQEHRFLMVVLILLLCFCIAWIDYITGSEIRVYPLYFGPVMLAAYFTHLSIAMVFVLICSGLWVISNVYADTEFDHVLIWVWNTLIQGAALALVGYLVHNTRKNREKQQELARVDTLTGLPNIRAFNECTPQTIELCKRMALPVTIAYVDLDNFKTVNDTLGHNAGNTVLLKISDIMKSTLRTSDMLFRFGGDEFVALLPNTSDEAAKVALERLRQNIEAAMKSENFSVTASIGAVAFQSSPKNLEELVQAADRIMYVIKSSGKNRVQINKF
jgi:diguanylate cyclase (GGDEF)-like protein